MPRLIRQYAKGLTLTPELINVLLVKIANYVPIEQIQEEFKRDFNIDLPEQGIKNYRDQKAYQPTIERFREQYEAEIVKVELASKRRRLEELQSMYVTLKNQGEFTDALKMLAQIRLEREGNETSNTYYQFNQFNSLPDSVLQERMKANQEMIEKLKSRQIEVQNVESN